MLTLDQFETRLKEEAVNSIIKEQQKDVIQGGGFWDTVRKIATIVVTGPVIYLPEPSADNCDCSCNTEGCNCPT